MLTQLIHNYSEVIEVVKPHFQFINETVCETLSKDVF